ncbi:DUF6461 domain-containing protein [Lentzea xinjiangensis]|nr:DUF6461 domain-containing protein [Lentzea xinjiangensis]
MGEFTKMIRDAAPSIEALVPAEPAAVLGRHVARRRQDDFRSGPVAQQALRELPGLTAERLLGALELGVARLDLTAPDELVAPLPRTGQSGFFSYLEASGQSAMTTPMTLVEATHRGVSDLVLGHVRALLPDLPDLTAVTGDEAAIAARRGAAHLAVAVAVSRAVLNAVGTPVAKDVAAVIGIALGVTAEVLPEVPMPPAYERALLEKRRAEYRGGSWHTHVPVFDHEFLLVEELSLTRPDFTATGLAAPVGTGFAVRTGIASGQVPVAVNVLLEAPRELRPEMWDEVVEISYTAVNGDARLGHGATAPWPGEFRARVCASGRDEDDERYELTIWPAPAAEASVLKKTDRVGHLLRGEPAPPVVVRPEAPHRRLAAELGVAATVTVVTNAAVDDVVDEFDEDAIALEADGGVLVVELNDYRGSQPEVLERLSRGGRAASHFWNVNRLTRLSFARDGHLVDAREVLDEPWHDVDPEVGAALEGLSFTDWRHLDAKGITAVVRFTGAVIDQDEVLDAVGELRQ